MFLAFTFLSLPAYALFWNGQSQSNLDTSSSTIFNELILALSLGNLGESALNINELNLNRKSQRLEMFCETGVIGEITKHGIALVERFDNEMSYFEDTYCGTEISQSNKDNIKQNCFNNQFCTIRFEIDSEPLKTKCKNDYRGSRKTLDFDQYAFFLEFECNIQTIRFDGYGEISRTQLANIVMICDALICFWFIIHAFL